ncbi:MAG: exodeoxyribonuclease V subunit gamma [Moraxella sp.]|nr:exodeoxyribonuclease V subunit gamma [Moraxella sp.]
MFSIIQSNDSEKLLTKLAAFYRDKKDGVFTPFTVIVPAMVLEDYLAKALADKMGISTLVATQFWGQYQWQMIDTVLSFDTDFLRQAGRHGEVLSVPETAVLSAGVIRWRLFAYFLEKKDASGKVVYKEGREKITALKNDSEHPLSALLAHLNEHSDTWQSELWQLCDKLSRLYVKYLTERPDWLSLWAKDKAVNVAALIAEKDRMAERLYTPSNNEETPEPVDDDMKTPAWLVTHYEGLERAYRYLWVRLFSGVFLYRQALEARFWAVLEDKNHPKAVAIRQKLPKTLYLFTVQQLPQLELNFLKRLSQSLDVVLLHFNPSMMFWADIVDKNWLATQKLINPSSVYLKDYGHGLLSRLGKASRDTFAMLAELSGGADEGAYQLDWQDDFNEFETTPKTLLNALKKDILMLEESDVSVHLAGAFEGDFWQTLSEKKAALKSWQFSLNDDSLKVHNCHSLKRELEVARLLIGRWLNEPAYDGKKRQLSDVAIMMPDVESEKQLIASVFGASVSADGLYLPAKITGVANETVMALWRAILGVYELGFGRLYAADFFEWLLSPVCYESFGMTHAMAQRGCELLERAGFVRGLDERHLTESLHPEDKDYRRTLAYALDRLSVSLLAGEGICEVFDERAGASLPKVVGVSGVRLEDGAVIDGLCRIYEALVSERGRADEIADVEVWLHRLEHDVINPYFFLHKGTDGLNSIFGAMNAMRASVRANSSEGMPALSLPLSFVLDALTGVLSAQKIAAEPSGVINIGRFGSLRGMQFGLVIMLGMNLSAFPRTEPLNRLDLAKAGLARRGDRHSEEDDNGAFLEAIFQAKENCWIFYSGQSQTGDVPLLPATPVSELIAFIKNAPWQKDAEVLHAPDVLEEWLVTRHAALPFSPEVFERQTPVSVDAAVPQLWQAVYENSHLQKERPPVVNLPNPKTVHALGEALSGAVSVCGTKDAPALLPTPAQTTLDQLISQVQHPAAAYLKGNVRLVTVAEEHARDEPLGVDGLMNYQLLTRVLAGDEQALSVLYEDTLLPAGKARDKILSETLQTVTALKALLAERARWLGVKSDGTPSPLMTQLVSFELCLSEIKKTLTLSASLPMMAEKVWLNVHVSSLSAEKKVAAFLSHLCWQVARDDSTDSLPHHGRSLWQYRLGDETKKEVDFLVFERIEKSVAKTLLSQWLIFGQITTTTPVVLTPEAALMSVQTNGDDKKVYQKWLSTSSYGDYISKGSACHPNWQFILGDTPPKTALAMYLPWASVLYQPLETYDITEVFLAHAKDHKSE